MNDAEVQRVSILVAKITRLKAMVAVREAELDNAVRTIHEMAYERWPAGGRN